MRTLLLSIFTVFTISTGLSQEDAKAKAILEKLSAKTKTYKTLTADFNSTLENKQANLSIEQKGKLKINGDKFRLNLDDYIVITDGVTTWTYNKADNEIMIDNNADIEDDSQIKPSEIFTIWETGFKYAYEKSEAVAGINCDVIKLFPKDPSKRSFHTIKLYISANSELKKMIVNGKSGDNYLYQINKLVPNENFTESTFTYKASEFPGADVIDNR